MGVGPKDTLEHGGRTIWTMHTRIAEPFQACAASAALHALSAVPVPVPVPLPN